MSTPIQNNSEALQRILQKVNSLPSGGSSVQIVTGTFNTGDGMQDIPLDFFPDVFIVHVDGYTDDDGHTDTTINFYFPPDFDWETGTVEQMTWSDKYYAIDAIAYLVESNDNLGLSIWSCDESWKFEWIENETYSYTAIKFT